MVNVPLALTARFTCSTDSAAATLNSEHLVEPLSAEAVLPHLLDIESPLAEVGIISVTLTLLGVQAILARSVGIAMLVDAESP